MQKEVLASAQGRMITKQACLTWDMMLAMRRSPCRAAAARSMPGDRAFLSELPAWDNAAPVVCLLGAPVCTFAGRMAALQAAHQLLSVKEICVQSHREMWMFPAIGQRLKLQETHVQGTWL